MNLRTHDEVLTERFSADPEEEQAFLGVALEEYQRDKDVEHFMRCLRLIVEMRGGTDKVAQRMKMTEAALEKRLSSKVTLYCLELTDILHGLGYELTIEPLKPTQ